MPIKEVITDWITDAGGGFVTVMWFDDSAIIDTQLDALQAMWSDLDQSLVTTCSWDIRNEGRIVDETTGTLTNVWADSTGRSGGGSTAAEPVPDASQILVRWITNDIVDGRFVKGRTFVPGLASTGTINGNIGPGVVPVLNTATDLLVDANVGFGVWHRPSQGAGGSFHVAQSSSVWSELAVLRRRRQ